MRAPFLLGLVLLTAFSGPLCTVAAEGSSIRISLIHGQNDLITDNLADCQKFRESLIKLFGYQRYERLGSAAATVPQGGEALIQPTWAFEMKVRSDSTTKNLYHYELFQEKKHLLGGKFIPKDRIPFIIRGPQYNQGILILVVYKDDPQTTPPKPRPLSYVTPPQNRRNDQGRHARQRHRETWHTPASQIRGQIRLH